MTNITGNLYAERDHEAMGDYYLRHVDRMTREGLHAKSDIAAELGFRDMEIDHLRARLNTAGHAHLDGAHLSRKVDGCLLCEAMTERETLRARVAELEAQERGGWVRTSGWSNELYSFDRSDNEDGTFSLTVSERGGDRLVDIDRLTASDLERIVDVVGDGVVSRPAAELEAARGEPVAWMLKTGHGTALATTKPKCEVDLWVPLFALKD